MNRLVILGSSITALAVVRDAHAHGLEPWVVDTESGIAFRSRWAKPALARDAADAELLSRVTALAEPGEAALVATGDRWVRFVMRHRAALDGAFAKVFHPANGALEICLGKVRFAEWCRANGLSAPAFWIPRGDVPPPGLGFPMLVRPSDTQHEAAGPRLPKAAQVETRAQLAQLLAAYREQGAQALVTESLLTRKLIQYSVPFVRADGRTVSFVARKIRPLPERCAVGTCVELSPNADVKALAEKAVERLDYYGIGEVEVLHAHDTGRNFLIEINARPWLQYALAPASGHDFLGILIGREVPAKGGRVVTGKTWIDFRADLYAAFSRSEGAVTRGGMAIREYLSSLVRSNVYARFDRSDLGPASLALTSCTRPAAARDVSGSHSVPRTSRS
jgi:predicted ATP-grasp superfamily ATP-dependent carboligase